MIFQIGQIKWDGWSSILLWTYTINCRVRLEILIILIEWEFNLARFLHCLFSSRGTLQSCQYQVWPAIYELFIRFWPLTSVQDCNGNSSMVFNLWVIDKYRDNGVTVCWKIWFCISYKTYSENNKHKFTSFMRDNM